VITSVAEALGDLHAAALETPLLAVVGQVVTLHARLGAPQLDAAGMRRDFEAAAAIRPGLRIAPREEFESDEAAPPVWSAAVAP